MMLRTWMVMWKEFIQISRDPRLLVVVLVFPMLMLLLYGYAINFDVTHLRLAIYDQDRSRDSRRLIEAFSQNEYFDIVGLPWREDEIAGMLDRGDARVVLVIPPTYSRDLADGHTAQVQVLVDGSDSTSASTGLSYLGAILQQHSARISLAALERQGIVVGDAVVPIENRTRYWYNPELRSTNFLVPGLIAVILMVLSALLTSVTVVRERERGTIEQLVVSPVRPLELMLGKLIPYVLIAFGDVLLILLAGVYIFHIPFQGSPWLVLLQSGFFLAAALGLGLFISTIAPNQQVAMVGAVTVTQLPTVLLSGFIFPISSMPQFVQAVAQIMPATHFIIILRAVILKGNTLVQTWQPGLFLLGIGLAMLALSTLRFKKTI